MISNIYDWLKINKLKYLSRDMSVSMKTIKCSGLAECVSSFTIVLKNHYRFANLEFYLFCKIKHGMKVQLNSVVLFSVL